MLCVNSNKFPKNKFFGALGKFLEYFSIFLLLLKKIPREIVDKAKIIVKNILNYFFSRLNVTKPFQSLNAFKKEKISLFS